MIPFKTRHLLLVTAALLFAACVLVVALRYRRIPDAAELVKTLPSGVEVALKEVDYTHTVGGVARWRLAAREVEHRSEDKAIVVAQPHMTFFDEQGVEQGTLTAERGRVEGDYSVVRVEGAVTVVSRGGYTLSTDALTYRQADHRLSSTSPVTLTSAGMRLEGSGLELDLATRRLFIPGRVHAVTQQTRPVRSSQ